MHVFDRSATVIGSRAYTYQNSVRNTLHVNNKNIGRVGIFLKFCICKEYLTLLESVVKFFSECLVP
jgi:hypothetical protein